MPNILTRKEYVYSALANLGRVDDEVTPLDMRREIREALESGTEARCYAMWAGLDEGGPVWFAFFPKAGRGAVAAGGPSVWFDADSLEDAVGVGLDRAFPDDFDCDE